MIGVPEMAIEIDDRNEWLETDGLGGYASGTVTGRRSRRYHGLLIVAAAPPAGRMVLVNGLEVRGATDEGPFALSSERYTPDVVYPDGADRIAGFEAKPWPTWTYRLPGGGTLLKEVFVRRGLAATVVVFRLADREERSVRLEIRPLLSGRGHHSLHVQNAAFRFEPERAGEAVTWHPYDGVPPVTALANGAYDHKPLWFRNFLYTGERERGLECVEDLASPGVFSFDLANGTAVLVLTADPAGVGAGAGALAAYRKLRDAERSRRRRLDGPAGRAVADFLVTRGAGESVVAGYPWFTDWGRDTFIALRGICLASNRYEDARRVLLAWASHMDRGMLPNRFPETGSGPEFNSVDSALWFVLAADEFLEATRGRRGKPSRAERAALRSAIAEVLTNYHDGTRHGIRADSDGLLACGEPGSQLTWMDAKVDGSPVTSRAGKPVEVQALWINALRAGGENWRRELEKARASFEEEFWFEEGGYLYDVVDVDHVAGAVDSSFRPNQIFAAGGLPLCPISPERARRVVDQVEARLLTPLGLRTLDPSDPAYLPGCGGSPAERDRAYHQGTAWPWLLGPFVTAWVAVRGNTEAARREAEARFLMPLREHLEAAGVGHISEIVEGEAPYRPAGCPFQAWSLGEYLRLERLLAR